MLHARRPVRAMEAGKGQRAINITTTTTPQVSPNTFPPHHHQYHQYRQHLNWYEVADVRFRLPGTGIYTTNTVPLCPEMYLKYVPFVN